WRGSHPRPRARRARHHGRVIPADWRTLARCAPPESLHRLLDLQPSAHGQPHELRRTLRSVAAGKEPALRSPLTTTALTRRQALLRPHLRGTGVAPTERDRPHP